MPTTSHGELIGLFRKYLDLVGDSIFIDISRTIDPARLEQPWESLKLVSENFAPPKVVQIWTKGPRKALEKGHGILTSLRKRGTIIICQLTVTGFGPEFEPLVPWPVDWEGIDRMIDFLATPQALLWRYDPVIPGISDLKFFEEMANRFSVRGIRRAVYNWGECGLELVRRRMGKLYRRIDFSQDRNQFAIDLERIGRAEGIDFFILAEGEKLGGELRLSSRGSWQYEWLNDVCEGFPSRDFLPGVFRSGCMCAPSFDIGLEGRNEQCHGCVYCFAK